MNEISQKQCLICKELLPRQTFYYSERKNSYCYPCSLEVSKEQSAGGKGAAERVRQRKLKKF